MRFPCVAAPQNALSSARICVAQRSQCREGARIGGRRWEGCGKRQPAHRAETLDASSRDTRPRLHDNAELSARGAIDRQASEQGFRAADVAKSDIDVAAEAHARESLASARLVMEKLYRRNPREWHKGGVASADGAVAKAYDPHRRFSFPELDNVRGSEAIVLALRPDYRGDRVFAFGVGLGSMIFLAYNGKTDFYITDSLDAQKLYNSARNVEIAAWKLANARGPRGEPLMLSNEMAGDAPNLSFEREFGKIIAYQDIMAQIAAQRTNRTIRRVVQTLATAVFLPI